MRGTAVAWVWLLIAASVERGERITGPPGQAIRLFSSKRWYENGQLHWQGTFQLGGPSGKRSRPGGVSPTSTCASSSSG